jgi:hypothetical protein
MKVIGTDLVLVAVSSLDLLLQRRCSTRQEQIESIGDERRVFFTTELVIRRENPLEVAAVAVLEIFPCGIFADAS